MPGPLPEEFVKALAQKLRDDQLVVFAGAGLSMQAKARDGSAHSMPGWDDLLTSVARRFGLDPAHYGLDRLSLLDDVEIDHGRGVLNKAVRDIIADDSFVPGEVHNALKALPWTAICTTNYDTLLDRCLVCEPIVTEDDFKVQLRLPRSQRRKLFKLHGSIDNPHTLTARDYKRWASSHPVAHHFVKDLLVKDTFLFVGYSLNDPHWKALLDLVEELVGSDEKWLYALVWKASDAELRPLKRIHRINGAALHSNDDYVKAFEQLRDAIGKLEDPSTSCVADPSHFSYDREQYARAVRRTYGYADLGAIYQWGAGFARDDVSLVDIFVPPDLRLPLVARAASTVPDSKKPDDGLSELERARRRHVPELESGQERRKSAAATVADTDRLLIIGAPGQGKSTLLRHLLLSATDLWLNDPTDAPFPCLVRLSQWSEAVGPPEGRLQRYLTTYLPGFAEISSDAAAAWYEGKVLWLLDGIDEIRGTAARERFREELVRLAAPGSRHRFVVSTRPAGEPHGGLGAEWLRTELPVLAESQVLRILQNWSAVLEKKDALHLDPADFAARLADNTGLSQVRGNALLLTMAVLFFKQRKRLPNDRWEFYDGAEQSLRDSWARHRLSDKDAAALPGEYAATVLESLALDGMCEGHVLFTADQVATTVRSVLTTRGYSVRDQDAEVPLFLDAARDAIGVLVEQAAGQFGFVHLTFQEFLAARALVKRGREAPGIIAKYWDHPDWREAWLLYALGCQTLEGRFSELFAVVLESSRRHELDTILYRPERIALRLAGVGWERLPDSLNPALTWACRRLEEGESRSVWDVIKILSSWERQWPELLRKYVIDCLQMSDARIRRLSVAALAARSEDEPGLAALLAACSDENGRVRQEAIAALSPTSSDDRVRVALLTACKDNNPRVRLAAVQALASRADDELVCAALLAACKDDEYFVRHGAVEALQSRLADERVRDALFEVCKVDIPLQSYVKAAVVRTLSQLTQNKTGQSALLAACTDREAHVREIGVRALSTLASDHTVHDVLLNACTDRDERVREGAVQALTEFGVDAPVRPVMCAACHDNHPDVRAAAIGALAACGSEEAVRAVLVAAFRDRVGVVRCAAVRALSQYADDEIIRGILLTACTDIDADVRHTAIHALSDRVEEDSIRAAMLTACGDSDSDVRSVAVWALSDLVVEESVRETLLSIAKNDRSYARDSALEAVSPFADHDNVRAVLLAACNDHSAGGSDYDPESVREIAIDALSTLARDLTVLAAILAACEDESWGVRHAATKALSNYADDKTVHAALLHCCEDDDEDVRASAVSTLESWIVRQKNST